MKTIKNDFFYRGQHFSIVYDGKFYMTVNHKFIGADGRIIKELHYNELHPGTTLDETITLLKNDLDIQFHETQGLTKAEAFAKVMNVPLEIANMIYETI